MAQNRSKAESLLALRGHGAYKAVQAIKGGDISPPLKVVRVAKYPGGRFSSSCSFVAELTERKRATMSAFNALGPFWKCSIKRDGVSPVEEAVRGVGRGGREMLQSSNGLQGSEREEGRVRRRVEESQNGQRVPVQPRRCQKNGGSGGGIGGAAAAARLEKHVLDEVLVNENLPVDVSSRYVVVIRS